MTLSLILKCTVALNAEYFQLLRAAVYVGNIRQYCRKKMVTVCLKGDCAVSLFFLAVRKGVCYTVAMFIFLAEVDQNRRSET